jgi:hypothetical protein
MAIRMLGPIMRLHRLRTGPTLQSSRIDPASRAQPTSNQSNPSLTV